MKFTFITLFPEIIRAYLNESIIKKAIEKSLIAFETIDPKDFLESKERIDDKVYGGGPGMLLKSEPLMKALDEAILKSDKSKSKIIYLSNKITISMINGHATGGGCMLAISTDFRLMVDQRAKIALNEINIGLSLFSSTIAMLRNSIGLNKAKKFLLTGELISPESAKDIGLVDELYTKDELFKKSLEFAHSFEGKNPLIIKNMKQELMKLSSKELNDSDESIEEFLDIFYLPETQKILEGIKIKK